MAVSLRRCRDLLGSDADLSDEEVRAVHEQRQALAAGIVDRIVLRAGEGGVGAGIGGLLSEEQLADFEERAAIIEFDGRADRAMAEREAIRLIRHGNRGG